MSDTNRVSLRRVKESTYGETPASPSLEAIRQTSSSLTYSPKTVTSDEIRSDRQVADLILVGFESGGDIGGELSYGANDVDFEAALLSAWVLKPQRLNVTSDSVITAVTASSDTYTVTDTGADFAEGMLVIASGFTNAGNNFATPFRAQSGSNGTTVIAPASPGLTDESAPPAGAKLQAVGFQGASGDLVAAGTAKTISSTALDFTTLGLVAGEWVKPSGFAISTANNGWCRVASVATNTLTFDIVPASWADDAGTGATVSVFFGDYVRNGTTLSSYSYERTYLDHSPVTYEYFRGMGHDGLKVDLAAEDKAKVTVTLMGKDALVTETRVTTPTDVAAPTGSVLNTSANVGTLLENGSVITGKNYVLSAAITIKNNLRRKPAIGSLSGIGLGIGEFGVTVDLNTYFDSKAIFDKVINNTKTSFMAPLTRPDENNRTILFDLPRLKYSGGSPSVPGKNQDVMAAMTAQAIMHETLGYTMQVMRFPYLG